MKKICFILAVVLMLLVTSCAGTVGDADVNPDTETDANTTADANTPEADAAPVQEPEDEEETEEPLPLDIAGLVPALNHDDCEVFLYIRNVVSAMELREYMLDYIEPGSGYYEVGLLKMYSTGVLSPLKDEAEQEALTLLKALDISDFQEVERSSIAFTQEAHFDAVVMAEGETQTYMDICCGDDDMVSISLYYPDGEGNIILYGKGGDAFARLAEMDSEARYDQSGTEANAVVHRLKGEKAGSDSIQSPSTSAKLVYSLELAILKGESIEAPDTDDFDAEISYGGGSYGIDIENCIVVRTIDGVSEAYLVGEDDLFTAKAYVLSLIHI